MPFLETKIANVASPSCFQVADGGEWLIAAHGIVVLLHAFAPDFPGARKYAWANGRRFFELGGLVPFSAGDSAYNIDVVAFLVKTAFGVEHDFDWPATRADICHRARSQDAEAEVDAEEEANAEVEAHALVAVVPQPEAAAAEQSA